jgi:polyisoprenoid-binding protein YceI
MPATTFVVDKAHSEALFTVRHLITKVRGQFRDFEGTIQMDEAQPERSSVQFTIQAASIDTNEPNRDTHLKSPDFFDVERTPTITFASRSIATAGQQFTVTGTLTMHGVSKDVSLPVSFQGFAKDPWGNRRAGFETEVVLNRKDFGLNWNAALEAGGFLVGDDVRVSLSVQAVAQA